jgi:hypothetical protein
VTARPGRQRRAARLLVVDDQQRLLLFRDTDRGAGARKRITPDLFDSGVPEADLGVHEETTAPVDRV